MTARFASAPTSRSRSTRSSGIRAVEIAGLVLVLVTLVHGATAWAAGSEVLVRGRVLDGAGEGLEGAAIVLTRAGDEEWSEQLESGPGGRFRVFLRDGADTYHARIELEGYRILEGSFEPLVRADEDEREMGLGSTQESSFEIDFPLVDMSAEERKIESQKTYNAGVQAARERRFEDAAALFGEALEGDPESVSIRLALAQALFDARRVGEAGELFLELARDGDAHAHALEIGYHALRDAGRLEDAAWILDELWQKAPQSAIDELFELATLWRSSGEKAKARSAVERVLEVRPAYSKAHYFYARLLVSEGEKAAALRHFRRYLELDPKSYQAAGVEAKIRQLEAEIAAEGEAETGGEG